MIEYFLWAFVAWHVGYGCIRAWREFRPAFVDPPQGQADGEKAENPNGK